MTIDVLPAVASCDSEQILIGVFSATAARVVRRWQPSQANSLVDISIPTVDLVLVMAQHSQCSWQAPRKGKSGVCVSPESCSVF